MARMRSRFFRLATVTIMHLVRNAVPHMLHVIVF
jgi:hypothetical protein